MSKTKLLSVALIAAGALTSPAWAVGSDVVFRLRAMSASAGAKALSACTQLRPQHSAFHAAHAAKRLID